MLHSLAGYLYAHTVLCLLHNKCLILFHIDVDKSLFADGNLYFTNIKADRLICVKELRFYIEAPGKNIEGV